MERAAFVQYLDPDRVEEYRELHEDVPDPVTDAMRRGGVEWFDLFVRDEVAVCVLAAEDVDEFARVYGRAMEEEAAVEEWERVTGECKRAGVDADAGEEGIPFMDRVWSLD